MCFQFVKIQVSGYNILKFQLPAMPKCHRSTMVKLERFFIKSSKNIAIVDIREQQISVLLLGNSKIFCIAHTNLVMTFLRAFVEINVRIDIRNEMWVNN